MRLLDFTTQTIAEEIPGATEVLYRFKLDYTSNSETTLGAAIAASDVDEQDVLNAFIQIQQRDTSSTNFYLSSEKELIDYLLVRYHKVHRQQMPELLRLAKLVETMHANHKDCPLGLSHLLRNITEDTLAHMDKEETLLFPMLINAHWDMAANYVAVIQYEHEEYEHSLHKLLQLTQNFRIPNSACSHWKALYIGLSKFVSDLREHIHTEDKILFSRIPEFSNLYSR